MPEGEYLLRPLVSVVCTTYNHEAYIRECLDGFVLQKTNFPIEIIVHDDASTDSTVSVIKEYEEKYPHLFHNIYRTENWYSQGKNIWGYLFTQVAKGKYIAICEGDDYWTDPLKLQKQVDILENNPGVGMVYSNFNMLYQKTGKLCRSLFTTAPKRFPMYYSSPEEFVLAGGYVCPPSWMYRKECLPKENMSGIDGTFILFTHFLCTSKVYAMPDVTATYRVLEESASHFKGAEKLYEYHKQILKLKFALIDKYNFSQEWRDKCQVKYCRDTLPFMIIYKKKKDIKRAKQILVKKMFRDKILFMFDTLHLGWLLFLCRWFYGRYLRRY